MLLINACIFGVIIENNMEVKGEKFTRKFINRKKTFDCKVLKIINAKGKKYMRKIFMKKYNFFKLILISGI